MNRTLSVATKVLAALAAGAFIVATVLALVGFNVERNLFDPEPYKRSLAAQGIYQRIPALAAEQLVLQQRFEQLLPASDPRQRALPPHLQFLTQADYEAILSDLLTPEWTQEQIESVIDQVFLYWNTDAETVPVTISIAEIKARFTGEVATRTFGRVLGSWPECNLIELLGWSGVVLGAKLEDLPVCRPPDAVVETVLPIVSSLLSEAVLQQIVDAVASAAVTQVPDEVVIFQLPTPPEEIIPPKEPPIPREQVIIYRWLGRLSPLPAIVLLAVTVILGARSLKGLLLWGGVPLLLAGLAGVLVAGTAYLGLSQIVRPIVLGGLEPPTAPGIAEIALRVGEAVARPMVIWGGVEAAVIAGVGAVLSLGGGVAAFLSGAKA
jgi:hypothetical protein